MNTKPELILQALLTALQTDNTLAGGNIWRSRVYEIPEEAAQAIVIRPATVSDPDRVVLGQYRWTMNVALEFYARGDVPDGIADPTIKRAFDLIMADRTLGDVCDNIEPGAREWEFETRDTDLVVSILELNIEFTTSEASL